jgi:hypothetical protein
VLLGIGRHADVGVSQRGTTEVIERLDREDLWRANPEVFADTQRAGHLNRVALSVVEQERVDAFTAPLLDRPCERCRGVLTAGM